MKDYISCMSDVIKKGHAEMVPEEQLLWNDGRPWYIPYHGVYHTQKESIQVVDSYQSTALDSDLTNTLLGILVRFRQESLAMMGDIQGMFHQVKIPRKMWIS